MDTIKLRFVGKSSLLMHSARGADPLDPMVKELKKLTSKKKKTDEDHEAIARTEWEIGLYHDPDDGPVIPAMNVLKTIVEGARKIKLGTAIESAVHLLAEHVRLLYKGPRDVAGLYAAGFWDRRSVGVQMSRTMRCRPKFRAPWSLETELVVDTSVLNPEQVVECATYAGNLVGLGDYRPYFGRFDVEVLS